MGGIFDALAGLAAQTRRPNFRTPPFMGGTRRDPRQTYPYPQAGPVPVVGSDPTALPAPTDVQPPPQGDQDAQRGWLSRVYEGLVKDPAGQAFTLTLANSLARPRMPGETGMGQIVNGITQGYSALGMLANQRLARQEMARKAGLEERKTRVDERGADTAAAAQKATETNQTDMRAVDRERIGETREGRVARDAQDQRQHEQEMEQRRNAAEQAVQAATAAQIRADRQYELDKAKAEQDKIKHADDLKYKEEQLKISRSNASANQATAKAAVMRAQAQAGQTLKPADIARVVTVATKQADDILKNEFDATAERREQVIRERVDENLKLIGGGGQQAAPQQQQYKEGDTATGPNGQRLIFKGGSWKPLATDTTRR